MSVYTAAIITVSDKGSRGERIDTAGPACAGLLKTMNFDIIYTAIVPDEASDIQRELRHCTDELGAALVLTSGGTGLSKRDITPESVEPLFDKSVPGIAMAMLTEGFKITPRAALSRAVSGIRKESLIITLPGSEKAARENLSVVLPALTHGIDMIRSSGSNDCAGK